MTLILILLILVLLIILFTPTKAETYTYRGCSGLHKWINKPNNLGLVCELCRVTPEEVNREDD